MPSHSASPPTTPSLSPSPELMAPGVALHRGGGMHMMLKPQANLPNFFEDFLGIFCFRVLRLFFSGIYTWAAVVLVCSYC